MKLLPQIATLFRTVCLIFAVCFMLLVVSLQTSFAQEKIQTVQQTDGKTFPAALTQVDSNWNFRFTLEGHHRTLPPQEFFRWGSPRNLRPRKRVMLLLRDNTQLVGFLQGIKANLITLQSDIFGKLRLPQDHVQAVIFQVPSQSQNLEQMIARLQTLTNTTDQLILDNEDFLTGSIKSIDRQTKDSPEGQIESYIVQLASDEQTIPVDTAQITAIRFRSYPGTLPQTLGKPQHTKSTDGNHALIGFTDGSLFAVQKMTLLKDELKVEPILGVVRRGETWITDFPEDLCFVQLFNQQTTYLSQRKAEREINIPFLSQTYPHQNNRNVLKMRMRADDVLYPLGIGVKSTSGLSYTLQEPYQTFQAELALDDAAGKAGSVIYQVMVDKDVRYTSPMIRGGDEPVSISVDITNARRLTLLVRFAEQGDTLDYANWLNARLLQTKE